MYHFFHFFEETVKYQNTFNRAQNFLEYVQLEI